jgi:hypothetical protein
MSGGQPALQVVGGLLSGRHSYAGNLDDLPPEFETVLRQTEEAMRQTSDRADSSVSKSVMLVNFKNGKA